MVISYLLFIYCHVIIIQFYLFCVLCIFHFYVVKGFFFFDKVIPCTTSMSSFFLYYGILFLKNKIVQNNVIFGHQ